MRNRPLSMRQALVVLVVGLTVVLVPAVAGAGQGASCTRTGDGAAAQPGTIAQRGDVLIITGTDRADSVAVSDDAGSIRVATSFSGGGSYSVSLVEIYGCRGGDTISVAALTTPIDLLVHGDGGRDTIGRTTGGGYRVTIDGGSGNDEIHAGDVADFTHVRGGDGNDEIIAGDQSNSSNSAVEGGPGNDRITVGDSPGERWLLYGGPGNDTIAAGDQLDEGPLVWGEEGNDTITVGRITDGRVNTDIAGGPGRDVVTIGNVAVFRDMAVSGGSGGDSISLGNVTADDATVEVNGGDDNDTLSIGDVTLFNGVVIVDGGPNRDRCTVGEGAVTVANCER